MISTAREWRWAGDQAVSPWYPSMRLFRQTTAGDWSGVVSAMADELIADEHNNTVARPYVAAIAP